MLPTYNRADYLEQALLSALAQDPGPEQMQIEVVDNSSTDAVQQVVSRLGSSRVVLYHEPKRINPTEGMNLCLTRARGQWVHILHDDDFTQPGFYTQAAEVFNHRPEVGAVLVRNDTVDPNGRRLELSRLLRPTPGVLDGWLETIAVTNNLQYVSIAVRREVYETVGAFDPRLRYAADWDMWKRIAMRYPVWYLPEPLASYRIHPGSDSTRLVRTAGIAADTRLAIELSGDYLPPAEAPRLMRLARRYYARSALNRGMRYLLEGKGTAGLAHLREGWKTYPSVWHTLRVVLGGARRALRR